MSLSKEAYINGILQSDKLILSRAITLLESTKRAHYLLAQEVLEACLPYTGKSIRIGITGVPGVGKSTFIESIGELVLSDKKKLAVLAIDPTSQRSKGSILGDKTRMESLSGKKHVFIRPSPAGNSLGGVSRKTRETILLCEAAGFDTIFIETVGVGQSETAVHSMVDMFLLLMLPGAGDELQGIKRGIMEMADAIVINKVEEDNIKKAKEAVSQYKNALHLMPPTDSGYIPKVLTCSALTKNHIDVVWKEVLGFIAYQKESGFFDKKRKQQHAFWFRDAIQQKLLDDFYNNELLSKKLKSLEQQVVEGKLSIGKAFEEIFSYKK